VVIVPENHTRNLAYLENLAALLSLFEAIGVEAQLGSLIAQAGQPILLEAPSGRKLTEYPITRNGDRLLLENGFSPDLIIINNDMTSGSPELLQGLRQPVAPPLGMGWHRRRKSAHFAAYRKLVDEFGAQFSIDSWLLCAEFHQCGLVDFKESTGLDCVAHGIETVLARVREKYRQYGIKDEPYVFVKADSGTYGMGIMTVRAPEEILELNKKARNKMQVIKEGTRNSEVILQEGIPTIDRIGGKVAEPMVYMIDGIPAGGMYRVNGERDALSNLNAAGMEFIGMCDEAEHVRGEWKIVPNCHFRSFGIVAAIAALAAAREIIP
jgi:glutamate--cysteine ligase